MTKRKLVILSFLSGSLLLLLIVIGLFFSVLHSVGENFIKNKKTQYLFTHYSKPRTTSTPPINILVVSGGGVLGIIPLKVLTYLEQQSDQRFIQSIDLFAGTSTGAIIVSALDHRISAANALTDYLSMAPTVFKNTFWHRMFVLNGFIGPLFQHEPLEDYLKEKMNQTYMHGMIKPIIFFGFNLSQGQLIEFSSWKTNSSYADIPVYKLLVAVTSAPIAFSPYPLLFSGKKKPEAIVDGVLVSNAPEVLAYLDARRLFPKRDIRIISLGDGSYKATLVPRLSRLHSIGLGSWIQQIVPILIHSHTLLSQQTIQKIMALPNSKLVDFYRINMRIPTNEYHAFKASPTYLTKLAAYGDALVQHKKRQLDKLAAVLSGKA